MKFNDVTLPTVGSVNIRTTRLYVEKPIPGRSFAHREDVGATGDVISVTGEILGNLVSTRGTIKALAGTKGELDLEDGSDPLYVLALDPNFALPDTLNHVSYEIRFAELSLLEKASLSDTVIISEVLSGALGALRSLSDDVVISELLKSYKRGPNFGFSTVGSQSYPTLEEGQTSYTGTTPMDAETINTWCTKITVAAPCTVKQIHIYLGTVVGNKRVAIYDNSSPANKLGQSATFAGTLNAWNAIDLTSPAHLPSADTYWLVVTEISGNGETYGYTTGVSGDGKYSASSYVSDPGFPSTLDIAGMTSATSKLALHTYAVKIKGYIKATKFTLSEQVTVDKIRFYSHVAAGNVRVAIYDNASPKVLMVESGSIAVAVGWNEIDVSDMALAAGTYWLVWQYDDVSDAPSYTAGSSGDGFYKAQAYGAFPATISGETSSAEKWTEDGTQAWTEIT